MDKATSNTGIFGYFAAMSLPSALMPPEVRVIQLPLAGSGQMHPLTRDYLSGKPELEPYYEWPLSIEGMKEAIEGRKEFPIDRGLLVKKLHEKYRSVYPDLESNPNHKSVFENIQLLNQENTFTITTGHQLSLFTGPLYFIYKIISALKYAAQLNEALPQFRFVPVYWMASEDHDFEEINHIHFWGKELRWKRGDGSGKLEKKTGAVGRLSTEGIESLIDELKSTLSEEKNANELITLFKKAYLDHKTIGEATFYLVHELFGRYGLVIMDADEAAFKAKLKDVFKKDIFEQAISKEVQKTSEVLGRNYKLPVNGREINVFYLKDNLRERIIKEGNGFGVHDFDKHWTSAQLEAEIEEHPEHFSPNVILRPMYQELLLPNLAYIGGTNEIAYWLQLRAAFSRAGVFYPQLVVRDSVLWLGKKSAKELESLKIDPHLIVLQWKDVENKFYEAQELQHPSEEWVEKLVADYDKLHDSLQSMPAEFIAPLIRQMNLQQKEVKKWKNDIHKKQLDLQEGNIRRLKKIYERVYPEGTFQERYENFIPYYLLYGRRLFDILFENFDPVNERLSILIG